MIVGSPSAARSWDISGTVNPPHNPLMDEAIHGSPVDAGRALGLMDAEGSRSATNDAVAAAASGKPEQCTVEVRYTSVLLGTNHAFLVTRDGNSTDYFRGGPSQQAGGSQSGPLSGASSGSSGHASGSGNSNSSNSANASSPGSARGGEGKNNGPWGPIVTDHGAYRPGTIDWTTTPTGRQTVAVKPGNCDGINEQFARHADDIERAQIPYNPVGSNSNAAAREILERAGFHNVTPVVVAPGWSTQLPLP